MTTPIPARLVVTFEGGWADGLTVDSVRPETWESLPPPVRMILDPHELWDAHDGFQLGRGFMGVSPEGLRQVGKASDEAEARKRMREGFRHQYKVTDRRDEDGEVYVTMSHSFLKVADGQ